MKLKRLFTAVLSTALALSLCAMPAMAVEGTTEGETPTPVKTSTSTIDTQKEGSITIYKRALEHENEKGTPGDGETMTTTPQGTALKDTGFTLYQVMNTTQLLAYYNNSSTDEVKVEDYFTDYDEDKTAAGLKTDGSVTLSKAEVLTKEDGKAEFTGLEVGMYLVIETKTPQAVTVPVDPFLVSIPMTRIGDKTTDANKNQNQKEWLYDVTVYPKNSIAKGDVTLVKKGEQGGKTTNLAGVQFTLYRKSDTNDEYTQVQTNVSMETDAEGKIALNGLTKGRYYLKETGYAANKDTGYILNTTGKFYFDINGQGKAVNVDDTAVTDKDKVKDASFAINNNTLTVTNYKPDIVKTVTKRDNTKDSHEADYGIGDAVPFTLTIDVPKNVESLKTFKVTDTTDVNQLKHNENPVTVKGIPADTGKTEVKFAKDTDYTLNIDTNGTMTIDFGAKKSENLKSVAGGKIIIDYTATVQKTALVAGDGNVNTAKIVYSRKTGTDIEEGTDGNKPYEITDQGVVYTFGLTIHKTAKGGDENGKDLTGVTFDLYKKVDTEKPDGEGKYPFCGNKYIAIRGEDAVTLGLATNDTEKWIKVATLTTKEEGKDSVKGLPSGTYKLVETKTVKGYNLLSKPVDAKLNLTYTTTWTTKTEYDAKGNQIKKDTNTTTYTRGKDEVDDPSAAIEIVNRAGFTLPVTGGFGTLLFSGIGVLLVLAGVGVLFSLKKKPNRA